MTVSEMIEELALALDDPTSEVFTDTIRLRMINRAQERVVEETLCYRLVERIDLSDDANRYELPAGFLKEFNVQFRDSGDNTVQYIPRTRTTAVGDTTEFNTERFYFIEREVNGLDKSELVLWPSQIDVKWTDQGSHPYNGNIAKVTYASQTLSTLVKGDGFSAPAFAHEAIYYEALSRLSMHPRAKLDINKAMFIRQQADRELSKVRRKAAQVLGRTARAPLTPF